MPLLDSPRPLARPSSVVVGSMTAAERKAFGTGEIAFCLDPREIALEYNGSLVVRERLGSRDVFFNGGSLSSLPGGQAIDLTNVSSTYGLANFRVPSSFFFACAINIRSLTDANALIASQDSSGNRLQFSIGGGSGARFDVGTGANQSISQGAGPTVKTGPQVAWCTNDGDGSGAAAFGVDAVTPQITGTFANPHKGTLKTLFFGGSGNLADDAICGLAIVVDRHLIGDDNAAVRATLLGWLAAYAGSGLAV